MKRTGSCLCGNVTYETSGDLRPIVACHCTQCRKTSGNFVAATSALKSEITISGDVTWFASSDGATRGFCATCGGNLFWQDKDSPRLSIFAGTLDDTTGLILKGHIYVDDKASYIEIPDDLPAAGGADPGLTTA